MKNVGRGCYVWREYHVVKQPVFAGSCKHAVLYCQKVNCKSREGMKVISPSEFSCLSPSEFSCLTEEFGFYLTGSESSRQVLVSCWGLFPSVEQPLELG